MTYKTKWVKAYNRSMITVWSDIIGVKKDENHNFLIKNRTYENKT